MSATGDGGSLRAATSIIARLRDAGHEAWLVGGCVRESLLGRAPKDHDVTTSATPDDIEALFERTVGVGRRFGVMLVLERGIPVEVATFRTEGSYSDGRRPDSVTFATAREDVLRRDFTINGLLQDPLTGEVADHVGGRDDLARRVLRTVGDARERFGEDRLRMLRAVRFAARLHFELDAETAAACRDLASTVTSVSPERVREELTRMLLDPSRGRALELLDELGLLPHVLPEISALHGVSQPVQYHPEGDVFVHVVRVLCALPDVVTESVAWAALLHDIGKPATWTDDGVRVRFHGHEVVGARMAVALCRRLRFAGAVAERIELLVRKHLLPRDAPKMRASKLRRLLAEPWYDELLVVARADAMGGGGDVSHLEALELRRQELGTALPAPLVTGEDLRAAGVPPGPAYRGILEAVRDAQLEGLVCSREEALALALTFARDGGPGGE